MLDSPMDFWSEAVVAKAGNVIGIEMQIAAVMGEDNSPDDEEKNQDRLGWLRGNPLASCSLK